MLHVKVSVFSRLNVMTGKFVKQGVITTKEADKIHQFKVFTMEGTLSKGLKIGFDDNRFPGHRVSQVSSMGNGKLLGRLAIRLEYIDVHVPSDKSGIVELELEEPWEGILQLPPIGYQSLEWGESYRHMLERRGMKRTHKEGKKKVHPIVPVEDTIKLLSKEPEPKPTLFSLKNLQEAIDFANEAKRTGLVEARDENGKVIEGDIQFYLKHWSE